ncbi:hypothetical protein Tco_0794358 [Tanacetum coccineum]
MSILFIPHRVEVEKDFLKPSERELKNSRKTLQEEEQVQTRSRPIKETEEEKETADYEEEKDELRMWLTVVPDEKEFVDPKVLHTKFPIVD